MSPDTTLTEAFPGAVHPGGSHRRFRHWLGTDAHGYDVAAGLISGARIAVLTAALAMCIAFGIGLILGAIAGYWGDDRLRIRRGQLALTLLGLPFAWFYASTVSYTLAATSGWLVWLLAGLVFGGTLAVFGFLGKLLRRWPVFAKPVIVPADMVIMRAAEIFTSIPLLVVIIAFASLLEGKTQSIWVMISMIGAFSWTGIARFVRAELLRIREMDYVTVARGLGLPEWRILFRHALPNAMRPAYTAVALGTASAILLEAALSFLGYGESRLQGATWGSLLQNAHTSPQLWWVSLPPGLAICLTILALNAIGEALSERR